MDQGRGNAPSPASDRKRGEVIVCAVDSVMGSQARRSCTLTFATRY